MRIVELPTFKKRYRKIKTLGKGTYGTVYKVYDEENKVYYAMKTETSSKTNIASNYAKIEKDYNLIKDIDSESIVKYYDLFVVEESPGYYTICLIMEYIRGANLYKLRKCMIQADLVLTAREMYLLFKHLVEIIQILHSHGVAHRDIKLENIILTRGTKDAPPRLKLVDFGLSCKAPCYTRHTVGTYIYSSYDIAKQVVSAKRHKTQFIYPTGMEFFNDLWAIAICILELSNVKDVPYPDEITDANLFTICTYILEKGPHIPDVDEIMPIKSVLRKTLSQRNEPRPTTQEILIDLEKIPIPPIELQEGSLI